jgi:hypothetical protein
MPLKRPFFARLPFAWLHTGRLLIAVLFILLFALAVRIPVDTDTWWHLRSGEATLQNRAVPQVDPFSITRGGQPWINQSWLSQLVMVAFYRGFGGAGAPGDGGSAGLAIYTALLATAGMVFVYRTCPGNSYARAFIAILSASTAAVFWSARPQMMSFFLSTVILFLLERYKRRGIDQLWLIPPLMVLWVNLHSGFAIGFIFIGAYIGGEILGRLTTPKAPDLLTWRQIGKLIVVALIGGAALIINPYTIQMLTYPFRTAGIGSLQQYIQEWASPNFHGQETWPFLGMLFGILAAVGFSKRGLDWTDLALTTGTAFMALIWQRNFAVFAVAGAPVLARHVDYILANAGVTVPRPRRPRGAAIALNWAILLLVVAGAGLKVAYTLNPTLMRDSQTQYLPVRVSAYLNRANPPGPMFNTYNWGGYLMFAAPQYPVFVDGRTDLYDDKILNQWRLAMLGEGWQQTFNQYGIRLVVVEKGATIADILARDPGWQQGYQDDQAVVYVKNAQ